MNIGNNINGIAIAIAIVAVGVIAYVSGLQFQKNNAVDSCSHVALQISKGEFVQSVYQLCMRDKGYEAGK